MTLQWGDYVVEMAEVLIGKNKSGCITECGVLSIDS